MAIRDVEVTITTETPTVSRAGFGLPLVSAFDQEVEYALCADLSEVVDAGFDDTTDVYDIAARIFAQTPTLPQIAVWGTDLDATEPTYASITEALNGLTIDHNDWYFLLTPEQTAADVDELAAWADSNGKFYFFSIDTVDLSTLDAGTLATEMAVALCHSEAASLYPGEGWVGKCAPFDPGSITWKFKQISGVGNSGYEHTDVESILDDNGNVVTLQGGVEHTTEGTTLTGEWIDVIRGRDWMTARIKEAVFGLLVESDKVPYTQTGIDQVIAKLTGVLQTAVDRGVIARDAEGYGRWQVYAPDIEDISDADKADRILPDVEFEAILAGAIHEVRISGVLMV